MLIYQRVHDLGIHIYHSSPTLSPYFYPIFLQFFSTKGDSIITKPCHVTSSVFFFNGFNGISNGLNGISNGLNGISNGFDEISNGFDEIFHGFHGFFHVFFLLVGEIHSKKNGIKFPPWLETAGNSRSPSKSSRSMRTTPAALPMRRCR